jgi:hypothetical protein
MRKPRRRWVLLRERDRHSTHPRHYLYALQNNHFNNKIHNIPVKHRNITSLISVSCEDQNNRICGLHVTCPYWRPRSNGPLENGTVGSNPARKTDACPRYVRCPVKVDALWCTYHRRSLTVCLKQGFRKPLQVRTLRLEAKNSVMQIKMTKWRRS